MTERETLAKLGADYPLWQVWTVHRVVGGTVWCAKLWSDDKVVINAESPDELREYIDDYTGEEQPGS